jgi:hypothetical protein
MPAVSMEWEMLLRRRGRNRRASLAKSRGRWNVSKETEYYRALETGAEPKPPAAAIVGGGAAYDDQDATSQWTVHAHQAWRTGAAACAFALAPLNAPPSVEQVWLPFRGRK